MSIILQSSGGGSVTIAEPATASNFTQTLPAVSGTIITTGNQPAGSILQVVQFAANPGIFITGSTSYVATNTTATITPKFSTSKILIFYNASMYANQAVCQPVHTLYRNSTDLAPTNGRGLGQIYTSAGDLQGHGVGMFLDSPSTTSATTYTVYVKTNLGQMHWGTDGGLQTMTLMEVAA